MINCIISKSQRRWWILLLSIVSLRLSLSSSLPANIYGTRYGVPARGKVVEETRFPIVEDDIKLTNIDPYQRVADVWLRSAVTDKAKVWTDGIIPFYVDETFFDKKELKIIQAAIEEFHMKTCVRFIPRTTHMPYLFITPLSRCWSEIGMPQKEGIRTLSLGPACLERRGTVIHELMHILGFWHEQNRVDRDDYITVNWENIREGLEHNFLKYNEDKVDTLQEPYDYQSIMHYSSYAFTKNPFQQTIVPKIPAMIGQRFGLSPLDVRKIDKLYRCSANYSMIQMPEDGQQQANGNVQTGDVIIPEASVNKPANAEGSIVFPNITDFIPLPFKFNWRITTPKSNDAIVFVKR